MCKKFTLLIIALLINSVQTQGQNHPNMAAVEL